MKILFCAYRDWALRVYEHIKNHHKINEIYVAKNNNEMTNFLDTKEIDLVLFCGWSTPPSLQDVDRGVLMVSEHPASSDRYSLGTPLQNQILDNILFTKHRIVKVSYPELILREWCLEVDMDLTGNMEYILEQMEFTSKILFNRFLEEYPCNILWRKWDKVEASEMVPRRKPEESKMDKSDFSKKTTKQIYDNIRMLGDPYPNAFIEDDTGILFFKKVHFKSK
jgi:hypothetical protein